MGIASFACSWVRKRGFGLLLVLCLELAASQGKAQSGEAAQCIPVSVKQAVEACPRGAPQPEQRGGKAPASHLAMKVKEEQAPAKQRKRGPSIELSAAERRGQSAAVQQRALELLRREIETTERIVG
ncbi:MAG: hypothetical protein N2515_00635, partial [Deltaproteobacteria bacterium]|nr:hypothetical protein [Deltaproteobacteria bacterium]